MTDPHASRTPPPAPPFPPADGEGEIRRGRFRRWRVHGPAREAEALARGLRVGRLVGQLLARRGVTAIEAARRFVEPSLKHLHDPRSLPGCARAAERLVEAVRGKQAIVIYGDYDVDGITATAILFHIIKAADADADVRCYVPHRLEEGYGLNTDAIAQLCDDGAQLIVSVDCGITATEPAAEAKRRGVDLIITDHHEFGPALPEAHTLVHPRLPVEGVEAYPFGELCGAGVAYKLAWQFARTWCGSETVSAAFRNTLIDVLPLGALGTIADVVPLVDENRVIAIFGLQRIKHTPWIGLNTLIDASRLRDEKIGSYHVGFVLGPRLNACGRMGHAKEAVRLLTDAPPDEAQRIAEFLNRENDRRRATERTIFDAARQRVAELGYHDDSIRAIVLADESWHAGVVGIVCSRLVERFGRPAILLSVADGEAHGSGRSIEGYNLHEALTCCAEHLTTFGGHAMAAGMRLPAEAVEPLREALVAHAFEHIHVDELTPMIDIDAEVSASGLTVDLARQIQMLEPFGRDNPAPRVLLCGVKLAQAARTMGREARHLSMLVTAGRATLRCVAWSMGRLADELPAGRVIDLVGEPQINAYRGRTSVELRVIDLSWADDRKAGGA